VDVVRVGEDAGDDGARDARPEEERVLGVPPLDRIDARRSCPHHVAGHNRHEVHVGEGELSGDCGCEYERGSVRASERSGEEWSGEERDGEEREGDALYQADCAGWKSTINMAKNEAMMRPASVPYALICGRQGCVSGRSRKRARGRVLAEECSTKSARGRARGGRARGAPARGGRGRTAGDGHRPQQTSIVTCHGAEQYSACERDGQGG